MRLQELKKKDKHHACPFFCFKYLLSYYFLQNLSASDYSKQNGYDSYNQKNVNDAACTVGKKSDSPKNDKYYCY